MTKPADVTSIVRDALIEGRTDALPALATEARGAVMPLVVDLVQRLQATVRAVSPTLPDRFEIGQVKKGQRFARIIHVTVDHMGVDSQRLCWGFVELSNGLVWKCATHAKPALNYPRGCVFDVESRSALGLQWAGCGGPAYHEDLR